MTEPNEIIETIGSITKMENLCPFEDYVVRGTLVLKNTDPFPGYMERDLFSRKAKSQSIFIVLKYRYAPEKINRINKNLVGNRIVTCNPSFGEIITRTSVYPCIRFKKLDNPAHITVIQNFFKRNDLHLMEYHPVSETGKIKIFKTFRLAEITDGLYRDMNEDEKIYIRIPKTINWKTLDHITKKIKLKLPNNNFDTAVGNIYRFCGPEDVIRIFDRNNSVERAFELKKFFLRELSRDILISARRGFADHPN